MAVCDHVAVPVFACQQIADVKTRHIRAFLTSCAEAQGRNVFVRDMEPFIKWLDEAEEEDED